MEVFVKSKNIKLTKKELKSEGIGNFYSGDRFYTLLNEYIDTNLKHKSMILYVIITYLFRSSNYKHDPSIANGRAFWPLLIDIFCVLSFITFICLIIATMGTAIIQAAIGDGTGGATSFIDKLGEVLKSMFTTAQGSSGSGLYMIICAIIFGIIGIGWMIMFFKIRKKNAALSLVDYVTKKVNTILKLRWLLRTKDKAISTVSSKEKKSRQIFCINKFEDQGGAGNRWLNIQLVNLLISIFPDFNLVFRFDNLADAELLELQEVTTYDFKNVELLK